MNKNRITAIARQCSMFLVLPRGKEKLVEHCTAQLNRPNLYGEQQHLTINPRRQLKKLVKRMVASGQIQLS